MKIYKVLLLIDKFGWSYDTIAKGIVSHNKSKDLEFEIFSLKDQSLDELKEKHSSFDLVFAMGWQFVIGSKKSLLPFLKENFFQELSFIDRSKLITGIHSHRSWDHYKSMPEKLALPPKYLIDELNKLKAINPISKRLYKVFKDAGLTNIFLTENGVDHKLFHPKKEINTDRSKPLIVGFSGSTKNKQHDFLKGVSKYILPLQNMNNIEIRILGENSKNRVPREKMPDLYNEIDIYLCASTSEGFSQSVLEASACGRGIVSTRVGGCEDLIEEGHNGFFIKRDIECIKSILEKLEKNRDLVKQIGVNSREKIVNNYSWEIKVSTWLDFIKNNIPNYQVAP